MLQKLKFSKNVNNENVLLKSYSSLKKNRKIRIILDLESWHWKSEFYKLLRTRSSLHQKNIVAEFTHLYIPSMGKKFFSMRHNLGHSQWFFAHAVKPINLIYPPLLLIVNCKDFMFFGKFDCNVEFCFVLLFCFVLSF